MPWTTKSKKTVPQTKKSPFLCKTAMTYSMVSPSPRSTKASIHQPSRSWWIRRGRQQLMHMPFIKSRK